VGKCLYEWTGWQECLFVIAN